jgi:uncharacterized protein YndB with AHSA1/START domain
MSTLEWVVSVGAGLIAPFALVTVVGLCLPRRHAVARSITLKQSPHTVWDAIATFERIPSWWPQCALVERLPDHKGRPVYRQAFFAGRQRLQAITLEVVEAERPTRFVTRVVNERGSFKGEWVYEVAPASGGCTVTLTEHGEIANPFVRTMFRLTTSKTRFIDSNLGALAAKFGERVVPR